MQDASWGSECTDRPQKHVPDEPVVFSIHGQEYSPFIDGPLVQRTMGPVFRIPEKVASMLPVNSEEQPQSGALQQQADDAASSDPTLRIELVPCLRYSGILRALRKRNLVCVGVGVHEIGPDVELMGLDLAVVRLDPEVGHKRLDRFLGRQEVEISA